MPGVSLVLPTYNRLGALQATLPGTLRVRGVSEIIVVDDASEDPGVLEYVEALGDPRVRVLRQPRRRGQPAARNSGASAATGDWVVFGEDDCHLPPDYVESMLAEAAAEGADLVGAPWVWSPHRPVEETLARLRAQASERVGLDEVLTIPTRALRTPFLPALALVHRRVFERVRYDEGYRGNAYREETDFFVSAVRAGFVAVLTPRTYSWQTDRWGGGAQMPRWAYEAWTVRNNVRFLRRHGRWLAAEGLAGPPLQTGVRFAYARARLLAHHYLRPLAERVRGR